MLRKANADTNEDQTVNLLLKETPYQYTYVTVNTKLFSQCPLTTFRPSHYYCCLRQMIYVAVRCSTCYYDVYMYLVQG